MLKDLSDAELGQLLNQAINNNDPAAERRITAELGRRDTNGQRHRDGLTLPGAALWYAGTLNTPVFPIVPGGKRPLTRHGLNDATTDPERIRAWWAATPDANIGLRTGMAFDVIDIDGPDGAKSWAGMLEENTALPPILGVVSTPRDGGTHLYIPCAGYGNRAKIRPGVDLRGQGGYVLAPPSRNAEGITYRWQQPISPTPNPPEDGGSSAGWNDGPGTTR